MLLRAMGPGDTADVARLSGQLGYPASAEEVERRFRLLAADADHAVFVAEAEGGGVAGWVHVHGRRMLEADPFAEIGGLIVDAGERGRGVGGALMARAEEWALGRGYGLVRVRSNTARGDAHRFYQDLGYRLGKTQYVFTKSLPAPGGPTAQGPAA